VLDLVVDLGQALVVARGHREHPRKRARGGGDEKARVDGHGAADAVHALDELCWGICPRFDEQKVKGVAVVKVDRVLRRRRRRRQGCERHVGARRDFDEGGARERPRGEPHEDVV